MKSFLAHLFLPRESNHHKSFCLHSKALLLYILAFILAQVFLPSVSASTGSILGYASNINVLDLLKFTNERRLEQGLDPLAIDTQLSEAAKLKAQNMFEEQYWSHTSPSGNDPWVFFSQAQYSYLYAGENLARDFADSRGVVEAWMNSRSHQDNILNSKYQDVGFAVVDGKFNGFETTLVVQLFGAKAISTPKVVTPGRASVSLEGSATRRGPEVVGLQTLPSIQREKVDLFEITKWLSILLAGFLAVVLVIDAVLIYRRGTIRVSGHSLAHFLLIVALLVVLVSTKRGIIL